MEVQQLRHLQAAANSTSYAQAAKKCFTSRQNIAHSIKALESELGVVLFFRKGNTMELTPDGKRVAKVVDDILAKVEGLRTMFAEVTRSDVELNLAVSTNLFAGMPTGVDDLFFEYSSNLRFYELECAECYRRVCDGEVDAAVVMSMERQFPGCEVVEIGRSTAYIITNKGSKLAQQETVCAADIGNQRIMLMSSLEFQYAPLLSQLKSLGFDSLDTSTMPSTSSMIHLVRMWHEGSVGIASKRFGMNPPRGTASVPFEDSSLDWHFYVLVKVDADKKASVMKFVKEVKSAFALGVARWSEEEGENAFPVEPDEF